MRDPYAVLGVLRSATDDVIKDAAREQFRKWHPDRPNGDDLRFREAVFSQEVLLDPMRRAFFDEFGAASFAQGFHPEAARAAAAAPTAFKVPLDRIEGIEMAGNAVKRAGAYLQTEQGQRMAVASLKAVTKLQTPQGVAEAKTAVANAFFGFLAGE